MIPKIMEDPSPISGIWLINNTRWETTDPNIDKIVTYHEAYAIWFAVYNSNDEIISRVPSSAVCNVNYF